MPAYRFIARLFRGETPTIAASIVLATFRAAGLVLGGALLRRMLESAVPSRDTRALAITAIGTIVVTVISEASALGGRFLALHATKRAIAGLRIRLMNEIYRLRSTSEDRLLRTRVHAVVVGETERVDCMISALLTQIAPAALASAGLIGLLVAINWRLTLGLAVVALPFVPLFLLSRTNVRRAVKHFVDASEEFSSGLAGALRRLELTLMRGFVRGEMQRNEERAEGLARSSRKVASSAAAYLSLQTITVTAITVILLAAGGWDVMGGRMSMPDLVTFAAIVAVLRGSAGPLLGQGSVILQGHEAVARIEALFSALPATTYCGTQAMQLRGRLALVNATFGYGGPTLLHNATLELNPGIVTALTGANGSGKTTITRLLLGLERPVAGVVYADGVAYDGLNMSALRRQIGIVPQDPLIVFGTIAENIAYGAPDASREAIAQAASIAGLDDFLPALPNGLDTQVGDEGALLSGGQRQRIALARAVLLEPPVLILDEPANHIDAESAAEMIDRVLGLRHGPSVLLITHDPDVAAQAQRWYVIEEDRLLERTPIRDASAF